MTSKIISRSLCAGLLLLITVSVLTSTSLSSGDESSNKQAPIGPAEKLSPEVPQEGPLDGPSPEQLLPLFEKHAWDTFVALCWPADTKRGRGVADETRKFGDQDVPAVWETWKPMHDLFLKGGQRPGTFDEIVQIAGVPKPTLKRGGADKTLTKLGIALEAEIDQASFNPQTRSLGQLIDQNNEYVRYEVRVNRRIYDFIRDSKYYLRENFPEEKFHFPAGSIEVKAAWRELPANQPQLRDKFYCTEAYVLVDPATNKYELRTMGLVGLHVVQRTPLRERWIWSTFEHVDNVPEAHRTSSGPFSFNNGGQPLFDGKEGCAAGINCKPKQKDGELLDRSRRQPVQVVRLNKLEPSTVRINEAYQNHPEIRDTVWKNYQLVAAQFPVGNETDFYPSSDVANITMETYAQNASCMDCHGMTEHAAMVWFLELRAFSRDRDVVLQSRENVVEAVTKALKKQEEASK